MRAVRPPAGPHTHLSSIKGAQAREWSQARCTWRTRYRLCDERGLLQSTGSCADLQFRSGCCKSTPCPRPRTAFGSHRKMTRAKHSGPTTHCKRRHGSHPKEACVCASLLVSSLFVSGSAGGRGRRSCGFHIQFDSHPVLHRSRVSSSIAVISPHFPGAADLCSFCRAVSVNDWWTCTIQRRKGQSNSNAWRDILENSKQGRDCWRFVCYLGKDGRGATGEGQRCTWCLKENKQRGDCASHFCSPHPVLGTLLLSGGSWPSKPPHSILRETRCKTQSAKHKGFDERNRALGFHYSGCSLARC